VPARGIEAEPVADVAGPPKPGTSSGITRSFHTWRRKALAPLSKLEGPMATRQQRQIVETPTEARQAEPGPSVLALLTVSTGLAMLILGILWFAFFRP
jgi:hypothetical protein